MRQDYLVNNNIASLTRRPLTLACRLSAKALAQAESLGAGRGEGLPCGGSSATPQGKGGGDKLSYFCMLFPPPLSPLPPGEGKFTFYEFIKNEIIKIIFHFL
jgi:hypothetical protein